MNVKRKGSAGEREVAELISEYGFVARRGIQNQGGQVEADVVGLPGFHLEVKRVERLNVHEAYKQSLRDAKFMEIPTVVHRRNREEWLITLPFRAFLEMVQREVEHDD